MNEFDLWRREINAKVAALDDAISELVALRNLYLMESYPEEAKKSRGTEGVSPAEIRRKANRSWNWDPGY